MTTLGNEYYRVDKYKTYLRYQSVKIKNWLYHIAPYWKKKINVKP